MKVTFSGEIDYREDPRNRIKPFYDRIMNTDDEDDRMLLIMEALPITELIPNIGVAYTFVYSAKTPDVTYDLYPLVVCTEIQKWGFKGYNFHWGGQRNYTWTEIVGYLHLVYPQELNLLKNIPYAKIMNK